MDKYKILQPLGDHSYSSVYKAENTNTGKFIIIVAAIIM